MGRSSSVGIIVSFWHTMVFTPDSGCSKAASGQRSSRSEATTAAVVRLRPDGESGLLISRFDAFCRYQREHAWVWEHQALTRARFSAGDTDIGRQFEGSERIADKYGIADERRRLELRLDLGCQVRRQKRTRSLRPPP